MIRLKSTREISLMQTAGRLLAEVHDLLEEHIAPGVSTFELDRIAEDAIRARGAKPAFLGYHGFPATLCTSLNEQIVHGIPSKRVVLKDGDLLGIDCGLVIEGYYSDAARTHLVGDGGEQARKLCEVTEASLWRAIDQCLPGMRLGDIGWAVEELALANGFSVVRDYVGHGIGTAMHELPNVPNYGPPGTRMVLNEGLVLAIEPMVNIGSYETRELPDRWTVVTKDGSLSAHYEHTVAITAKGPLVLTDSVAHPGRMTRRMNVN